MQYRRSFVKLKIDWIDITIEGATVKVPQNLNNKRMGLHFSVAILSRLICRGGCIFGGAYSEKYSDSKYFKIGIIIRSTFALFWGLKDIKKAGWHNVNIVQTSFMRFIVAIQSICCSTVVYHLTCDFIIQAMNLLFGSSQEQSFAGFFQNCCS